MNAARFHGRGGVWLRVVFWDSYKWPGAALARSPISNRPTMRCPFCQNPCHEETAECSHCGFSLSKLDQYLGAVPTIASGVCERAEAFGSAGVRQLRAAIARFSKRFPQIGFTVISDSVKSDVPLHLHTFWIFNRSEICAKISTGGMNRDVLLVIDVAGRRSSMMVGYGLEPFLSAPRLTEILESGRSLLTNGEFTAAVVAILNRLAVSLVELHGSLRKTYGAEDDELGISNPRRVVQDRNGQPVY